MSKPRKWIPKSRGLISILFVVVLAGAFFSSAQSKKPNVQDKLQPMTLKQAELSGEIGRRINDLIYKNFMMLDLDGFFIAPFRSRPFTDDYHYVGVGKVIDAGAFFRRIRAIRRWPNDGPSDRRHPENA